MQQNKAGITMKKYITPEIESVPLSNEDIMNGSDTFIDVGTLWSENSENA